ncbi:MAG TPA: PAS domain S-box protein [Caulobacteraceae bacterium]|nr:PAS domain S-box protein [Caulobacteraceae bacterium]
MLNDPKAGLATSATAGREGQVVQLSAARHGFAEREVLYRDLLNALPAAIYTTDADGRITFYNEAAVQFAGRRPSLGELWSVTWRLFNLDGTPLPHDQCPMALAIREGRPVRGADAIAERPDGSRITFTPYPTPFLGADGKVLGAVNMLVDITDRRAAEEKQRLLAHEVNHRALARGRRPGNERAVVSRRGRHGDRAGRRPARGARHL